MANIQEIRKDHPKAGLKWTAEEDNYLKQSYEEYRAQRGNFNAYVGKISKELGRAIGGLKARLAKYFDDVPGWDYARDKYRAEALQKATEELFTLERSQQLKSEYENYLQGKRETYVSFLKRMSGLFEGVKSEHINQRITELCGRVEKYRRDDINPFGRDRSEHREKVPPVLDLSGNPQAQQALELLEHSRHNIFLTGEAGTGKSTLLKYFRETTKKNVVVLAPTGVAALNVEGQTIHSFCAFGPDITLQKVKKLGPWAPKFKLLKKIETIVIDEISMVRADLLDCVDKFLRLNGPANAPFGGIQMVFVGDLHQLPPVEKNFVSGGELLNGYASPYFFDSRVYKKNQFTHVGLSRIYRQQDQVFISILNAVRNNAVSQEHLEILNRQSQSSSTKFTFEQFAVYLTTTNQRARQVNNFFLEKLSTPIKTYHGMARGSFEDRELPTDLDLQIKIGSQVMMLNNDTRKRWVNGTMGKIVGIEKGEQDEKNNYTPADVVKVELETGDVVFVEPYTWEMYSFILEKNTQRVESKTTGTFTQYPFKLAWAVTIHKAQGKSFDKVYIDLATGTFAHGQLYVALSRCRTLQGLRLRRPVIQSDILLDKRVLEFLEKLKNV